MKNFSLSELLSNALFSFSAFCKTGIRIVRGGGGFNIHNAHLQYNLLSGLPQKSLSQSIELISIFFHGNIRLRLYSDPNREF